MNRKEWFETLIREFRDKYDKLLDDEKKHISNLDDFTRPCQILSITFDNPSMTTTFIFHLSDVDDGTVWVFGPIKPYEAIELFEKIVSWPIWDVPLDKDERILHDEMEERNVRALLEGDLTWIIEEVKTQILKPPHPQGMSKFYFMKRSAIWTCYRDIILDDPIQLAENIIKEAKKSYKEQNRRKAEVSTKKVEPKKTPVSSRIEYPWYGTYLYPPIDIGKAPRIPFSTKVFDRPHILDLGIVVFEDTLDGHNVIGTHKGFIGIEGEKNVALEMLNMLCAALFLRDIQSFVIRDHELGTFEYDVTLKKIGSWSVPMSPRSSIMNERHQRTYNRNIKLTPAQLDQALRDAERYLGNPLICFYMSFLLESYTHLSEAEYSQSFFMSWVIIETYLTGKWKTVLEGKGISGKRLKKLKNPGAWSIDYLIETMNIYGALSDTEYETLMKLKKKRNNILHGTSKASNENANSAFSLALDIIRLTFKQDISKTS